VQAMELLVAIPHVTGTNINHYTRYVFIRLLLFLRFWREVCVYKILNSIELQCTPSSAAL
jgi:hypothetical protein